MGNTIITVVGTVLVALITVGGTIANTIISKRTNKKVDCVEELRKDFQAHLLDSDKTHLIIFLNELENGIPKTDIQIKRAYEIYERYTNRGGNSYVKDHWEDARSKGLL